MNNQELDKLQNELLNNINQEEETDKMIANAAEEITAALYMTGAVKSYEIDNKEYSFRFVPGKTKDEVIIVATNNTAFKITDGKSGIYTAKAKIEEGYSARQCIYCIIEAFIRHVTGNFKPDMIESN